MALRQTKRGACVLCEMRQSNTREQVLVLREAAGKVVGMVAVRAENGAARIVPGLRPKAAATDFPPSFTSHSRRSCAPSTRSTVAAAMGHR